jgi:hypothetical protein
MKIIQITTVPSAGNSYIILGLGDDGLVYKYMTLTHTWRLR